MERLVKDAAKLDKSIDANSLSYGNIVKAIHAVQVNMDIYGTTQKEAEKTITGSLNAMKSSWGNLLTAMASGENLDQCIDNMVDAVETFGNNVMPVAEKALGGIGTLIERLVPKFEEEFPKLAKKMLPPLIKAAVSLTKGLIKSLPSLIKTVATTIVDIFGQQFPIIGKIGKFFENNAGKVANSKKKIIIPAVIALVAAFKGFKAIKAISGLFGKGSGGGGLFSGISNIFKGLAETDTKTVLKGMANLTIILGGLGALVWVATKVFKQGIDMKQMLKVAALIGVFGIVGGVLGKFAGIIGNIPVTTVLKGFANMAIVLVGIGAVVWTATKVFGKGVDFKQMLKVAALIGVFGIVGTALSVFAGIVGLIPILLVVKGLANMAIVMGGLGALLFAATKVFKGGVDFKEMLKVISLIGILGTVGSVLSVFAGIVGLIPIPVVLAGLTNIGLVIGGITALIVAYGKLSEIPNFNEFISKGGDTLANLFGQIGKIGGALIGGIGEGISNALPKIGENIGKFGENIKPLFSAIQGVDMGAVGSFFTSLVGLLGIATGNEIIEGIKSFFGGKDESALAKLGTELGSFATNAKGFFDTVANMNPAGFTNAKLMLDSLAGLKSLPKDGGIVGWFSGNINYESISNGLGQLASENVVKFFNAVADIKQASFDNAKLLFDTLANMKSLPKDGGVVGWFSGDINYANIATGLGELAGDGVKNFFKMVTGFKQKTFDNAKKLFETLAGIKSLPKEGGFWQDLGDAVTGNETKSKLSVIASDLSEFGEKTKEFFTQVNSLNLDNLNGLWDSLKKAGELTTSSLSKVIDESISTLVDKISNLPKKMGDALKNNSSGLSNGMATMWKDAVKAAVEPVNKLLSGANHILKEFGSKKKVIDWKPYAKGTNGHKGGNALVNDGRGAELVQMPNGRTFIPQGRNVFLPNAPKGMKVLPAEQTASLMGEKSPSFRYAEGIGKVDIWEYYDNAQGLVDKVAEKVKYDGLSGFRLNLGESIVSTFKTAMTPWVKKLFDEEGGKSLASYVASKGVEQWRSTVIRALKMEGQYSEANVKRTLYQMQTESGGNPRAINLWDSNAKKGIPSKGLMQCIDPTFKAYARKGFDKNIYDPLSNILASIRYAVSRYGSLAKAYQGHGYANGVGTVKMPEQSKTINLHYTPENSFGGGRSTVTENNTYSPVFNLTINGDTNDRATERKVKRWISEAMDEVFSSLERKNRRVQEV